MPTKRAAKPTKSTKPSAGSIMSGLVDHVNQAKDLIETINPRSKDFISELTIIGCDAENVGIDLWSSIYKKQIKAKKYNFIEGHRKPKHIVNLFDKYNWQHGCIPSNMLDIAVSNQKNLKHLDDETGKNFCSHLSRLHISYSGEDADKKARVFSDTIIRFGHPKFIKRLGLNKPSNPERLRTRFRLDISDDKTEGTNKLGSWFSSEACLNEFDLESDAVARAIEFYLSKSTQSRVIADRVRRVVDSGIDPLAHKDVIGKAILKANNPELIAYGISTGLVPEKKGRKKLVKSLTIDMGVSPEAMADELIACKGDKHSMRMGLRGFPFPHPMMMYYGRW